MGPWDLSPRYQPDGLSSKEKAKKMIDIAMKKGSNFFEWMHIKSDGKKFPATVLLTKVELEGKLLLQATLRDISIRKKFENDLKKAHNNLEFKVKERTSELRKTSNRLQESEKKYRMIFENIIDGIIISDAEGKIISVNPATLKILGYGNADELIGKPTIDIYGESKKRIIVIKELLEKGYVKNFEMKLKKKDGTLIECLGSATLIKDKNGNISRIEGNFTDISDRKKIEKEIIQTKNNLQNVINSASEIIFAVDVDNKIIMWNKSLEDITNYKSNKIINRKISKLNIFNRSKDFIEYLKNVYMGNEGDFELTLETKRGLNRIFKVKGSIILENNQKRGILLIGEDITEVSEIHGKLLFGNSYLLSDIDFDSSFNMFIKLARSNNNGLLVFLPI